MSPASPENASRVFLFSALVLSSEALRMVAPRIAALDAAIKVKSLPVMPSRTSLVSKSVQCRFTTPHKMCLHVGDVVFVRMERGRSW